MKITPPPDTVKGLDGLMGGWMDGWTCLSKYVTVEKSIKTGSQKKSAPDARNSQVHSTPRRSQLHLFSAKVSWVFMKPKKSRRACQSTTLITDSEHRAVIQRAPHFQGYSNFPSGGVFQPMLARSLVFFRQVITLMLLCVSRGWHNQSVSVVWSGDSTHTHTHTRSAVTRSRVVASLWRSPVYLHLTIAQVVRILTDTPHTPADTFTHTPSRIRTKPSVYFPSSSCCHFDHLQEFDFFIPFHSLKSLFLNPPPPFF